LADSRILSISSGKPDCNYAYFIRGAGILPFNPHAGFPGSQKNREGVSLSELLHENMSGDLKVKCKKKSLKTRGKKFIQDVVIHTPVVRMTFLLVTLWVLFSVGIFMGEQGVEGSSITSVGKALYWGIAAFSTAGIADMPKSGISEFIGAVWIIVGSLLFFGAIVATVTAYFMRPLQRPSKQIIDTIEYNLEQLDDLSIEELELLKETTDSLIEHVERLKALRIKES
jgi:voltage-gated potassium channel